MSQLIPPELTAQISSILDSYSSVSSNGDVSPAILSGGNPVSTLTNMNNIGSLTSMNTLDPASLSSMVSNFALPAYSLGSIVLGMIGFSVLWIAKEKIKANIRAKTFEKRAKKFLKRYETEKGGQDALVKSILGELNKNSKLPPTLQVPQQAPQVVTPIFQIPPIPPIPQVPPHATQI